jgi:squalene-hopene/tetraprenyl-beta-curcumene cyclase
MRSFLWLIASCAWLLGVQSWAMESRAVKTATDKAGNWLVDQYNLGTGTFGKAKHNKMPGFNALVVNALCESPRKYREGIGPFISEPVKQVLKLQREDGAIAIEGTGLDAYNTALCILALKSTENPEHGKAVEKAVKYLKKCQGKDGGYGYDHNAKQGGDLSQTWLGLEALEAAGVKKDSDAYKNAVKFIRRCQDNPETNPDLEGTGGPGSGGAYYKPGGSAAGNETSRDGRTAPKPYGTMTAAMIESLLICEMKPEAPEIQAALRWFKANYSVKENPGVGAKGYFYYALAFAKAMTAMGAKEIELADGKKVNWAADLAEHLLSIQAKDGSFVNTEPQWLEDDPVLCTAYALKTLTLCYKALK